MGRPPDVTIASFRKHAPNVFRGATYEFEDVGVDALGGSLLGPADRREGRLGALGKTLWNQTQQALPARLRSVSVQSDRERFHFDLQSAKGDILVLRVISPSDLVRVRNLETLRRRFSLSLLYIEEFWPAFINADWTLDLLMNFDHVFVGHEYAAEALDLGQSGPPCSFVAPAVDAITFAPHHVEDDRVIDIHAMGRIHNGMHDAIVRHARSHPDFIYVYDSVQATAFKRDHRDHRLLLSRLIQSSDFFLADRAKIDSVEETQGTQVFGPRYFEGAAGGAILFGDTPKSDVFRSYFDWPDAVIEVPYGSPDTLEILAEFRKDGARLRRARRANIANTLRRHDWVHRWEEMFRACDIPLPDAVDERKRLLDQRAARIEAD